MDELKQKHFERHLYEIEDDEDAASFEPTPYSKSWIQSVTHHWATLAVVEFPPNLTAKESNHKAHIAELTKAFLSIWLGAYTANIAPDLKTASEVAAIQLYSTPPAAMPLNPDRPRSPSCGAEMSESMVLRVHAYIATNGSFISTMALSALFTQDNIEREERYQRRRLSRLERSRQRTKGEIHSSYCQRSR